MYRAAQVSLGISLLLPIVQSYVIWETPNELHPVHGLYVKPSIDGTTGDLYVAATEDDGVKSQWLTDQPVNFLPNTPKTKNIPMSLTSSVTKTTSPQEETIATQKRAVIAGPAVQYAYPLPVTGVEESILPISYAFSSNLVPEGQNTPPCSTDSIPPYPFHYFYPYMMSAIASAMNALKEGEIDEENLKNNPPIGIPAPYWSPTFAYPYQYFMADPSMWAQSQTNGLPLAASMGTSEETA